MEPELIRGVITKKSGLQSISWIIVFNYDSEHLIKSMKNNHKKIAVGFPEANLKRRIRQHLKLLGFKKNERGELVPPAITKENIRALHSYQRKDRLQEEAEFVTRVWPRLSHFFAEGKDVTPARIAPSLELVDAGTTQSDLFRLASLTWSVPVSAGYGRRLRFLVWDESNGKLMGLIALGDPVFNLHVRDKWIGWTVKQRKEKLVNVLDAFVLGAVPPYNALMCGKLIACLIRTSEVKKAFQRKYSSGKGLISKKSKDSKLCMVTTSSALGRSSVYNRLKLDGQKIFTSIGFTEGWGHFHISDSLFEDMRGFLRRRRDKYAQNYKYGDGPNWKLRAVRKTLSLLGMNPDLLRHGIRREVFIASLATNAQAYLRRKHMQARFPALPSVSEIGRRAVERWVLPRSLKRREYTQWSVSDVERLLSTGIAARTSTPASVNVLIQRTG